LFFLLSQYQSLYLQAKLVNSKKEEDKIKREKLEEGKLYLIFGKNCRQSLLMKAAQDITPKNGGVLPWAGQDAAKFE
jgi:hypothetical protein